MQDYQFPFEKLRVWQDARAWVRETYKTVKLFPSEERFGLSSQLTRAAVSVASNLAEGCGRTSPKDQAHFSQLAYGSLMEACNLIILAGDQDFITDAAVTKHREMIMSLSNQINALRISQLDRIR